MPVPELPAELITADAADIDEVVSRLERICAALPPTDGVHCFAAMYLAVTRAVQDAIAVGEFSSSQFLTTLDVRFANRFFDALTNAAQDEACSRSWRVLIDRRDAGDVTALQFALAGMNAHIDYDLAQAVVDTLDAVGGEPSTGDWHADFTRVNQLLDRLEPQIRASMAQRGFAGGDQLADFGIARMRELAWRTAELLWPVRRHRVARTAASNAIDDAVAASSEALLAGLPWVHPKLPGALDGDPDPIASSQAD